MEVTLAVVTVATAATVQKEDTDHTQAEATLVDMELAAVLTNETVLLLVSFLTALR